MEKIPNFNNKTNAIIGEIKKSVSGLVENQNFKQQNLERLKITVNKLQKEILELENLKQESKKIKNSEQLIKRKLIVKHETKSPSFLKWIINNKEL